MYCSNRSSRIVDIGLTKAIVIVVDDTAAVVRLHIQWLRHMAQQVAIKMDAKSVQIWAHCRQWFASR